VFDAALSRIAEMRPDRLVIACNTLSILYPQTAFSRDPVVPCRASSTPASTSSPKASSATPPRHWSSSHEDNHRVCRPP